MRRTSPEQLGEKKKAGTAFRRGSLRNLAQSGKGKGKEHGIRPKQRARAKTSREREREREKKSHGGSATHSSKFRPPAVYSLRPRGGGGGARAPSEKQRSTRRSTAQAGRHPPASTGTGGSASRRLPENCVKTASHEMLMSGG